MSMLVPVAALVVLSAVGGLLQVPGAWHLVSDFLHSVAEPLVEPTVAQDYLTSAIAAVLGLAGIGVAWLLYGARTREAPRQRTVQDLLEHKLYFDELYDALFYRPASAVARAFDRLVERPAIDGSIDGLTAGTRDVAGRVGRLQTGYLRVYALAIGAGAALLALVFVSAR
jgi:NADH-quinone oxidoreductase subunit L